VKKPLPNLGGRATQLPPLEQSAFKSTSKRSFSVKQHQSLQSQGRQNKERSMFATKGELNQSSAGVIPINNMYDGEDDREAAIPPPLEGSEEAIKESVDE